MSFPSKAPTQLRNRWVIGAAILLALAAALSVATFSRADLARQVRDAASAGLVNMKTVAAMLADRSPGQRPEGALASMKPEKRPALHERALPKIRKPESPLAGIVGTPTVPPVELPPATPLYSMVTTPPVAQTLVPSGPGGGSPPAPPPGGSGGIVVPPQTPAVPVTPVTPVTPAVPEPNTWAMMLVGFGLMGWAIRREKRAAAAAAG